jgi:hypothetical protein
VFVAIDITAAGRIPPDEEATFLDRRFQTIRMSPMPSKKRTPQKRGLTQSAAFPKALRINMTRSQAAETIAKTSNILPIHRTR